MIPDSIFDPSGLRRYVLLLCAAAALLFVPAARADFVIGISSAIASAGSTGNTLEVDATNTGPSAVTFGGFSFGISTSSPSIIFTDATTATTMAPYIFPTDSAFGPDITTSTGTSLTASDFSLSGSDTVAAGATVGLGKVSFDVLSGASGGGVVVSLAGYPTTSLSDTFGNNLSFTATPGAIVVLGPPPASAPEPSTLVLAMLACPAGVWTAWRRRAAAKRKESNDA